MAYKYRQKSSWTKINSYKARTASQYSWEIVDGLSAITREGGGPASGVLAAPGFVLLQFDSKTQLEWRTWWDRKLHSSSCVFSCWHTMWLGSVSAPWYKFLSLMVENWEGESVSYWSGALVATSEDALCPRLRSSPAPRCRILHLPPLSLPGRIPCGHGVASFHFITRPGW